MLEVPASIVLDEGCLVVLLGIPVKIVFIAVGINDAFKAKLSVMFEVFEMVVGNNVKLDSFCLNTTAISF